MLQQCWRGCVQGSGSISKYRKCSYIMKWDYIIWLAFFLVRHWSKSITICKKYPIFSVFCVFLNEKWSMWHYLYILVNLSQGATSFVKRTKQVAVFLVPWEFCQKGNQWQFYRACCSISWCDHKMWLAIFFPEIYAKQTVGTFYHNQKK